MFVLAAEKHWEPAGTSRLGHPVRTGRVQTSIGEGREKIVSAQRGHRIVEDRVFGILRDESVAETAGGLSLAGSELLEVREDHCPGREGGHRTGILTTHDGRPLAARRRPFVQEGFDGVFESPSDEVDDHGDTAVPIPANL